MSLRRLDEKLDGLGEEMRKVKYRLLSVERQVVGMRVDFTHMREGFVRLEARVREGNMWGQSLIRRTSMRVATVPFR